LKTENLEILGLPLLAHIVSTHSFLLVFQVPLSVALTPWTTSTIVIPQIILLGEELLNTPPQDLVLQNATCKN
jgi:hypothetical protein